MFPMFVYSVANNTRIIHIWSYQVKESTAYQVKAPFSYNNCYYSQSVYIKCAEQIGTHFNEKYT